MKVPEPAGAEHRERLAQRVSAASYGTVLTLAALVVVEAEDVASGFGWELVAGVGVATWVAHIYAEILGNHIQTAAAHQPDELRRAMADGLAIPIAAAAPAVALVLGRLDVVAPRTALWLAIVVALIQLVGLGAYVGLVTSDQRSSPWRYAAATAAFGLAVVLLVVALGH